MSHPEEYTPRPLVGHGLAPITNSLANRLTDKPKRLPDVVRDVPRDHHDGRVRTR